MLCETDVFFKGENLPSGNIQEAPPHYRKKHAYNTCKKEVSVLANGHAILFSSPERGTIPNITLYRNNLQMDIKCTT